MICQVEYVYQTKQKLYLNVFNMLIAIIESKMIIKLISYGCECKFDYIKCNLIQKGNNDKFV